MFRAILRSGRPSTSLGSGSPMRVAIRTTVSTSRLSTNWFIFRCGCDRECAEWRESMREAKEARNHEHRRVDLPGSRHKWKEAHRDQPGSNRRHASGLTSLFQRSTTPRRFDRTCPATSCRNCKPCRPLPSGRRRRITSTPGMPAPPVSSTASSSRPIHARRSPARADARPVV